MLITTIGAPSFNKQPDRTEITPEMQIGAMLALGVALLMLFAMLSSGSKPRRKRRY